jgi:histone H3/H4
MKKKAKLPLATFAKILKESGPNVRVSKSATHAFIEVVEEISRGMASSAEQFARHAGRKTITADDIRLARRNSDI